MAVKAERGLGQGARILRSFQQLGRGFYRIEKRIWPLEWNGACFIKDLVDFSPTKSVGVRKSWQGRRSSNLYPAFTESKNGFGLANRNSAFVFKGLVAYTPIQTAGAVKVD